MERGKKQKKNAAPAPAPPQKKIKKAQRKKGKAPLSAPSSSGPARIPPTKTPPAVLAPSGPAKAGAANANGVKAAAAAGGKNEGSVQRIGGYIFFCNAKTKAECYKHRVFGLPKGKLDEVEKIKKGTKLFLFDYDLKLLYGIYKAVSNGGMNLEAGAFNGNFPAQVKFNVFKDCYPLPEASLRLAIKENYNNKGRFKPDLSFEQVKNLVSLFQPIKNTLQSAVPQAVEERRAPLPPEERPRIGGVAYASGQVDPRYAPTLAPRVQNDPYASAAHVTRGPLLMEPALVPAAWLPPPSGVHHSVAGLPPPNDAYHAAAASVQTDSRAYYPQSSVLLERYRAIPQIMLPNEPPPAPARDYRSIAARDSEMAPRMELANQYYSTGRAVASAAELPPQQNSWAPGYESLNRMYADNLHRPVSSRANISNLPVSSLYSFAGAAPAYR